MVACELCIRMCISLPIYKHNLYTALYKIINIIYYVAT